MDKNKSHIGIPIEIPIPADKNYLIKESELFTKYAAVSQDDSFIVIFDTNNDDLFDLRMYKIITNEDTKKKELSEGHSESFTFTDIEDQEMMRSSHFLNWSVTVSNVHQEKFRLIAISCIGQDDMQNLSGSNRCGFTKIWMIENDFDIKRCNIEIESGGIIHLLSEADEFILILLKGNGIYKHRLLYSLVSKKFQHEILVLNYPERIINALSYNCSDSIIKHTIIPSSEIIRKYLLRCLSSHYLLVDTSERDPNKNIELYDLRTNQLMNVFKRYKIGLSILDREKPGAFAISNDEKLLAYVSGNEIKIYLIENGLELSSLSCKKGGMHNVEFMRFVFNNEKLLIFKKNRTVAVWDIFNSVRGFIEFIPFEKDIYSCLAKRMTRIVIEPILENEPFIILNIRPFFDINQIVWDKLNLNKHLKESGLNSDWKELDPSKLNMIIMIEKKLITDGKQRLQFPRYVIYLDVEKQTRLLIGYNSIQVWRGKKLEFIRIVNDDPKAPEEPHEKFQVTKIRYALQKFDLLISLEEGKEIQIKIEHEDDIIQIVRDAIKALVYFDSQSKSVNIAFDVKRSIFNEIVHQTRNIITRFITLYSNLWRLIDFRYRLMTEFINIRDFSLIARILFNKKNASEKYISQILSMVLNNNESEIKTKLENIISRHSSKALNKDEERPLHSWQVPLKHILLDKESNIDVTMLALFLEYYSNNAMDNIGWMNSVSEIISELYERKYGLYIQEFLFKPCFGNKELDFSSFKFHEIKKHSEDSLKVFIPITQLIPRDTDLNLINISDDEIPHIKMIPFIDFTTNKENQSTPSKFKKIITKLFLPGKSSSIKNEDYSPFIRIINLVKKDDPFYENPSMEAITNIIFILLGYIQLSEESDNPFANPLSSILAAFYWDSTIFDFWNFWPLTIINVIFGFLIVIVLEDIIISFMGSFMGRSVLQIRNAFIYNYAFLEGSSLSSEMNIYDFKFKDKFKIRYICFLDEQLLTGAWNEKSIELDSESLVKLEKNMD
ncbi:16050_t:CDS:2 [Dentiscutata erythropus]|uniref:16050_t:CDS:1 n=1 Tax=Dentiscutata erythropus TaxID=1348616 RepID=A0A9N9FAT4_9GLOM|nr:16050_t:CDS:2 [Dentiscutata erythropus]